METHLLNAILMLSIHKILLMQSHRVEILLNGNQYNLGTHFIIRVFHYVLTVPIVIIRIDHRSCTWYYPRT